MARKAKQSSSKGAKRPKASKQSVSVETLKNLAGVPEDSRLAKVIAQVDHMVAGTPDDDVYFGVASDGTKVFAIQATGERSGTGGPKSRRRATLHAVRNDELGPPLATVPSIRAGWVS